MRHIPFLILLLTLLAACSRVTATPAPTTSVPPATAPTVAPTAVPPTAAQAIREFSTGDLDTGGAEQPAGRYQTPPWFDVSFQFETTQRYRGGGKSSDRRQIFALERGRNSVGNATHRVAFFAFPSDVSGVETVTLLRSTPKLDSNVIRHITLTNVTGTQWDAVAQANPAQTGESGVADGAIAIPPLYTLMRLDGVWHTTTPEARLRFIMPDVPGRTMLIYVEAPQAEFDAWASKVEQLLRTVTFVTRSEARAAPAAIAPSNAPPGEIWGQPGGSLAIDAQDHVYVMREDMMIYKYDPIGNFRIQKFDSNGKFLKQWGSQGKQPGQFSRGWTIAVDSKGNVYVGDEGNHRVQKFDSDGNFLTQWGKFGYKEDAFESIFTVEVDHADNVYVGDYFQKQVKKFDSNGKLLTTWNSCGAGIGGATIRLIAFAFDDRNNIYMLDGFDLRMCIYDADGKLLRSWGRQGQGIGEFDFHEDGDIAIDSQGNLYVSDGATVFTGSRNNRIQKFRL